MRKEAYTLEVKSSAAAGSALRVEEFDEVVVLVGGAFTASVTLEGSVDDGVSWFDLLVVTNPTGEMEIPLQTPCNLLRANTTAYTAGTPAIKVIGPMNRS